MTVTDPHFLLWDYLTCGKGHQRHTSQGATCTCGKWEVWCSDRKEAEAMHDAHLAYIAKKQQETFIRQYQRDVSLHELAFHGIVAHCKGCTWMLAGMDRPRAFEAFSNHLATVKQELERKS